MRFTALAALALAGATALSAPAATAQDAAPDTGPDMMMMTTVSMLGLHAQNALRTYGIDADVNALTVNQLTEIAGILANPDGTEAPVKDRIAAAIRRQ